MCTIFLPPGLRPAASFFGILSCGGCLRLFGARSIHEGTTAFRVKERLVDIVLRLLTSDCVRGWRSFLAPAPIELWALVLLVVGYARVLLFFSRNIVLPLGSGFLYVSFTCICV